MNQIDIIRKRKHLSYQNIADKSGLTAVYVHMLAKNKRHNPSLIAMQKIALALDEKLERVFQVN